MGPCPHHRIMPLALGLQIITHPQAQLMRTNNFQGHLTTIPSKERKNSSWAGPGVLETSRAKLTVLKPLACFTILLRLSMETSPLCLWWGKAAGEPEMPRREPGYLSFPFSKSSLRPASSSDTWLILDPHKSLLFSIRLLGVVAPPLAQAPSPAGTPLEAGGRRKSGLQCCLFFFFFKIVPDTWELP